MKKAISLLTLLISATSSFAQNVGIGTATPQSTLHVFNGSGASVIRSETGASSADVSLELKTNGGVFDFLELRKWMPGASGTLAGVALDGLSQITTGAGATGGLLIGNKTAQPLYFTTGNLERMRITAGGTVGIGAAAPEYSLHIRNTSGEASAGINAAGTAFAALLNLSIDNRIDGNALLLLKYRSGVAGTFAGVPRSNLAVVAADAGAAGLLVSTNQASPIYFATNVAERMRITATGNVGIGVTNPIGILEADAGTLSETSVRWKSSSGFGVRHWFMMGNDLNSALVIARFGPDLAGNSFGVSNQNLSAIYTSDLGLNALAVGTKSSIPLIMGTNNAERMRIAASGSVGVGIDPSSFTQLHVRRAGAAGLGPGAEWGAILGENGNTLAGYGVFGYSQAPRTGAQGYAGVTGYNDNTGIERYGVIGMSNGTSSAPGYSAGVAGYGDYGVLGWSASNAGAGMIAQHASGKTALELNNGFLKVSGTNKTAFTVTANAGNSSGNVLALSYANAAASDIVLVTHNYNPNGVGGAYHDFNVGVYWNGNTWTIYNENTTIPILGKSFNVLVIKQ